MSLDQPRPKSVNSPTRTEQNAEYDPFRSSLPDLSASASTAVVLAKDYKMAPLWQPEQSTNNAKAAAVSHNNGEKLEVREPEAWASAPALPALPAKDHKMAPTFPSEQTISGATATANALKATTSLTKNTSRKSFTSDSMFTPASKEMFSSNPPVLPEVDEQNRQAMRSKAILMIKKEFKQRQKVINTAAAAKRASIAASRGIPLSAVTTTEIQSALESDYAPTSSTKISSTDSNEKSTEGPVVQGIRAVDTVSQASQSTVVSDVPFLRRKLVVVGDGASGKTALLL